MQAKKFSYFLAAMAIIASSGQAFAANSETGNEAGKEGTSTSATNEGGAGSGMAQNEGGSQNRSNATTEANTEHSSAATSESGLVPVNGGPAVPAIPSGVPSATTDPQDAHAWGAPKSETAPKSAAPGVASHTAAPKHSTPVVKTYHWNTKKSQ
jgi:hypothetical protein